MGNVTGADTDESIARVSTPDGEKHEEPPTVPSNNAVDLLDEKEQERLGRLRPDVFKSTLQEIGFCASVLLSNLMAVRTILLRPTPSQEVPANVIPMLVGVSNQRVQCPLTKPYI